MATESREDKYTPKQREKVDVRKEAITMKWLMVAGL
jgi:hypothetical protein